MADDDKNDQLMTPFIERATPRLLEALTTQMTEHVEKQISGLVENSTKLLDEVKDAKRERDEAAAKQAEDLGQLKTLLERGDDPKTVKDALQPEPIKLTRTQARDTTIYRRAREQAAANGTTLQILKDPTDD